MMKKPLPNDTTRQTPFTTPEGYFEELPSRIQRRVSTATPSTPTPGFFPRWAYYTLGAVVVLVASFWLIPSVDTPSEVPAPTANLPIEQLLAEVPTEVLINYLQESDIDVMATVPLTETEQEALVEQELGGYGITEEYINEINNGYLEEFF